MESHTSASNLKTRPPAFTLVEVLVAIGIIVLLVSLLLVAVSRSYGTARRVRAQADLQIIALGLEAYKQDFGDYPRPLAAVPGDPNSSTLNDGAALLAWALIGVYDQTTTVGPPRIQGDGNTGPGFRIRAGGQGKVYGPYIDTATFNITPPDPTTGFQYLTSKVLAADNSSTPPILYIPARAALSTQRTVTPQTAYIGQNSIGGPYVFDLDQCSNWIGSAYWLTGPVVNNVAQGTQIRWMMGDTNGDGVINGNETAKCTAPYILWTAGRGGMWGLRARSSTGTNDAYETDNIANFNFDPAITVK